MKRFTIWAVSLMMVLSLIPCVSFAADSDNNKQELNQEVAESEISENASDDEMTPAEEELSTEDNVATEEDNNNADEQPALLSAATEMPQNPRIANEVSTWDCVYFGNYPQTEIVAEESQCGMYGKGGGLSSDYLVDADLYEKLQKASYDSNGDTIVDGVKYRRISADDPTHASKDCAYFYEWADAITYHYFRYSKIKWRVLETNDGYALLLSDKALDNQLYNRLLHTYITWEKSTIRSWLNGYGANSNTYGADYTKKNFINTAFSSTEKSAIQTRELVNEDRIERGFDGGNNTEDPVFLLAESDVWNTDKAEAHGFSRITDYEDKARMSKSTTYAKAMGAWAENDQYSGYLNYIGGNCCWWIRSPGGRIGTSTCTPVYVEDTGWIETYGNGVMDVSCSVRPALYLDLSSSTWSNAGTVSSDETVVEPDNPEPDPEPVEKKTANLTFTYSNISKYTTDGSFKNELTKETDGEITYSSSNTGVAAVDSSGLVTIKGAGTTTITAKSSETSTYKSGEAKYTLTVEKKSGIAVSDVSYGFENFSKRVPISICKYMYGNTQTANDVYYMNIGDGGNCYGMAASSSILYVPNDLNAKSFDQSKSKISQLSKTNKNSSLGLSVENFIQAMHITQVSIYMKETRVRTGTLDKFVNVVKEQTNNGKPILLSIFGRTSQGAAGHAITVTGIKKETNTSVSLAVYDNNYPNEERTIIINKDSSGNCKSWEYELWSGLVWGTGKSGNDMWYSTYEDYYRVWNMRGKLANAERNLLVADTQDFEVVDDNSNSIAKVENGVLASENEDVVNLTPIGISPSNPQGSEYFVLSLPIDNYEIINNDATKDTLTVSISNKKLGTTVCTESDQVLLYAEDSENATGAAVKADVDEAYSIEVKTSTLGEVSSVKYDGVGNGLKVAINYSNGVIDTNNTSNATVSKGDKNSISINAGEISVKPSGVSYTYNGKAITPAVTVKDYEDVLKKDKNYKVSYSSNKNVGTGKITVTGINGLTDKKSLSFTINPKGTNLSKVSKGKKSFTVKWKKQSAKMSSSRITGYQVRYSTSSSMASAKVVTVKGYSKTSKKISRLKAKKKYYVQVRTYKTVSGKKYYSGWSSKKSVVTK